MAQIIRMKPSKRRLVGRPYLFLLGVIILLMAAAFVFYWIQDGNKSAKENERAVTTTIATLIEPKQIRVVDGDTIRANGQVYRLVGFDTPESGIRAQCESERALAARATSRLRQLVAAGGLRLERVPCACTSGTEGTPRCNYGRLCGVLTAASRDVATTMISEGLARRYTCDETRCPRRQSWCG
jgi:endonuclease YncB( thermonuclease family)